MEITYVAKGEGKNEVILTLNIYPENMVPYESANWNAIF